MAAVRIVTDSACDLPEDVTDRLAIEVVPLTIRFGDEELTDRSELSTEDFYAKLAESKDLPETAAPSPGAFEQAFRKAAGDGADAVVCINLSSQLSATMASAQNAAKALAGEVDVRVVDSRSITAGLGTQVMLAARAGADGRSADEVVDLVEDLAGRTRIVGVLDTLEYLKKGGRVGGARALLGTMLDIKPLIDISSGQVEEAGKQRTRKRAMAWLRDELFKQERVEHLTVCNGGATDVDTFLEMLAPRYTRDDLRISTIGAVIGTHGGPRVLGLAWLTPK